MTPRRNPRESHWKLKIMQFAENLQPQSAYKAVQQMEKEDQISGRQICHELLCDYIDDGGNVEEVVQILGAMVVKQGGNLNDAATRAERRDSQRIFTMLSKTGAKPLGITVIVYLN